MTAPPAGDGGFVAFFRRYTRTWLHGVSTAALTAFGALAVLHRGFVGVAIAAYVLPPVVMYATGRTPSGGRGEDSSAASAGGPGGLPTGSAEEPGGRTTASSGESRRRTTSAEEPGGRTTASAGVSSGRTTSGPETPGGRSEPSAAKPAERSRSSPEGPDGRSTPAREEPAERTTGPNPDSDSAGHWKRVDAPTEAGLHDVAIAGDAGYAVGADGVVLADDGGGWRTVLADGPGAAGETLRGVDATDDGGAVWVAGDGGTVARVDAGTDRHVDFTPPAGLTDNWVDLASAGPSDDEVVLLGNGSGEVLRGRYRDGDLAWAEPVKPGSGSSLAGVALADAATGYCCDTNDGVFETTDGGERFGRVGLDGADGTLTDVATVGQGDCLVSADDGVVHRHDGGTWTPIRLGEDALDAIARRDERAIACDGGVVFERPGAVDEWERIVTSAPGPLAGVAIDAERALAVGADGAILERR